MTGRQYAKGGASVVVGVVGGDRRGLPSSRSADVGKSKRFALIHATALGES